MEEECQRVYQTRTVQDVEVMERGAGGLSRGVLISVSSLEGVMLEGLWGYHNG